MRHIYAFEKQSDYEKNKDITDRFRIKLNDYQRVLEMDYALKEPPKAVVWTTAELATTVFSNIPLPAYTNKDLIFMSPDIDHWLNIFEKQLDGMKIPEIQQFYKKNVEMEMLIILAHELTHHSELFLNDFDDDNEVGIWFEEGMCMYLPRKLLLSEKEFKEITDVEAELHEVFKEKYGNQDLENFGSGSYHGTLSSIMFDYWRSYLAVKHLVEVRADGDVKSIFEAYHQWNKEGRKTTLTKYFGVEKLFG